jgi:hypothetical protein
MTLSRVPRGRARRLDTDATRATGYECGLSRELAGADGGWTWIEILDHAQIPERKTSEQVNIPRPRWRPQGGLTRSELS